MGDPKDPPKTVRIADDPFVIEHEAGSGGMGTVFRAHDRRTNAPLAVKVLRERAGDLTRFALEANVLAKLKHPSIVAYAHHGLTSDGSPYLAMEWLEGQSLERKLSGGVLRLAETLHITATIADALSVAHAAGVVHRDLKPSNVFLTDDGAVKLLDFGVAKCVSTEGLTQTGQMLGTPGYMSPEQARGDEVDARADLFSLACVVFRCLGGRRPFEGTDIMTYATKLALEDPPKLREVAPRAPVALERLVATMLEKNPDKRPASAATVRDELRSIADGIDDDLPSTEKEEAAATMSSPHVSKVIVTDRIPTTKDIVMPAAEPTMVSPAPVSETKNVTLPTESQKTRTPMVLGIAAIVAIGVAFVLGQRMHEAPAPPSAASSVPAPGASSAPTATTDDHALIPGAARAFLDRACKEWGAIIARSQRAEGGFAGEAHRDPVGWDTAQELFALAEAQRACGAVGPAPLVAGARALEKMRTDDGWRGGVRPGQVDAKMGQSPANAWALLALDRVRDAGDRPDPQIAAQAIKAKADLAKARNPDGGFRYTAKTNGASLLYSAMLGAWALVDTRVDAAPPSDEPSLEWLRRDLLGGSAETKEAGATEQIAFVLARAHRKGAKGGDEALRMAARTTIEHCRIQGDGCKRSMAEVGRIDLAGTGKLVTLFHPWATLAAYEILRDATIPVDADTRKQLRVVLAWGLREMNVLIEPLSAAPEYKVAEYLLAVSLLIDDRL